MKRSFLTALGIEKDIIDQIMSEHGNTVELIKEKAKEDIEKQAEKLQKTIDTLQEKIDSTPKIETDGEDWKAKHDTLQGEFDTYKQTIESEKLTTARRVLAETKLAEAGANPKAIKFLVKELELDKLKEDGSNWEELHKPIMEANSDWYGKVETVGAGIATPPANNGSNNYVAQLDAARKSGNTQEAVRIKNEAAQNNIFLI